MYMDDRYDQNPSLKYTLVKDQFNKGCTSPVMLYEAAKIISKQPELLRVINKFELLLLRFINKYDMYNDNLNKQIVTLFEKEKQFDKIKFDGTNKDIFISTIEENRAEIIKNIFKNGNNLYKNYCNERLIFTEDNSTCRLRGYNVDKDRKTSNLGFCFCSIRIIF